MQAGREFFFFFFLNGIISGSNLPNDDATLAFKHGEREKEREETKEDEIFAQKIAQIYRGFCQTCDGSSKENGRPMH